MCMSSLSVWCTSLRERKRQKFRSLAQSHSRLSGDPPLVKHEQSLQTLSVSLHTVELHACNSRALLRRAPPPAPTGSAVVSAQAALARADILSLHVPLLPQTRGLIGAAELAQMRSTALLINTCRGPVVDEAALVTALRHQQILGAGLDVFEREPLASNHPLLTLPNALLTPHSAGITRDTWSRRGEFAFANLRRVLDGAEPLSQIGAS